MSVLNPGPAPRPTTCVRGRRRWHSLAGDCLQTSTTLHLEQPHLRRGQHFVPTWYTGTQHRSTGPYPTIVVTPCPRVVNPAPARSRSSSSFMHRTTIFTWTFLSSLARHRASRPYLLGMTHY